jgi:hypothetical protein
MAAGVKNVRFVGTGTATSSGLERSAYRTVETERFGRGVVAVELTRATTSAVLPA